MRLVEGENHLISERDGFAICQIWMRPDLSAEVGAKNAGQMVAFLRNEVLRVGTPYRGIIFDVRRGPSVFGEKTKQALTSLVALCVERRVSLAIITSTSARQIFQFRDLCADAPDTAQVFEGEPAAVKWLQHKKA